MFDTTPHTHQLQTLGISEETLALQVKRLTDGPQPIQIARPATIGDGILRFDKEQRTRYVHTYDQQKDALCISRFVPASGMATRMFKFLYYFLEKYNPTQETIRAYLNRKKTYKLGIFLGGIEKLPFYNELEEELKSSFVDEIDSSTFYYHFIRLVLEKYGHKPKALVPFHRYADTTRTAFEEQFWASLIYAVTDHRLQTHFTIGQEHLDDFKLLGNRLQKSIAQQQGIAVQIDYSLQNPNTDTIALDLHNQPVLDENGDLIFRAGGHGALIENLNQIESNVVFISNIDNVPVESRHQEFGHYKKMLAGCMLDIQKQIFDHLEKLDAGASIIEAKNFLKNQLQMEIPKLSQSEERAFVINKLNRPIRVCGMVPNENEPGGGPFWVIHSGQPSLQIVEQAQMDKNNPVHMEALHKGTHFNPVDIVCGVYNYKGKKFDLTQFVDTKAYFVTEKSLQGKAVKALEHPGLWNGAMADWNTVFVEVPVRTFNPAKNVNDLLRPAHHI
ncbi:MAG: DUF4301 family protein [Flavobacteriaceae bacterium]